MKIQALIEAAAQAVGGVRPMARLMKISHPRVYEWLQNKSFPPSGRIGQMLVMTGTRLEDMPAQVMQIERNAQLDEWDWLPR